METLAFFIFVLIIIVLGLAVFKGKKKKLPSEGVPEKWKKYLASKIVFYRKLDSNGRKRFEHDVFQFLNTTKITGIQTDVTLEDRLLVASSAVIPLFGFPEWNYSFLDEVLLYPAPFDRNYQLNNPNEIITGMVGNGPMEGKMILAKPSLHAGFEIGNDKKNVGIHEFVHLFDKEDGVIDGVPPGFDSDVSALPWINLIKEKTEEIASKRSDINNYATTNRQEFFAVASEYFFERPELLQKKHPTLYSTLANVFNQDLVDVFSEVSDYKREIGRNEPCPCGSGLKFKRCCLE